MDHPLTERNRARGLADPFANDWDNRALNGLHSLRNEHWRKSTQQRGLGK
jgi:hypothetical protein